MSFPIHHHNRIVVLILDQEAVRFLSAGDLVPRQELGGPHDAIEDQTESSASEGGGPVDVLCTVKQVALVPGIVFRLTSWGEAVKDCQLPTRKVSETDCIAKPFIPLVSVFFGFIAVIHCAAVPGNLHVLGCVVQQELPQLRAHPSVPGEVGPVGPSTDNPKGLAAPLAGLHPVIID